MALATARATSPMETSSSSPTERMMGSGEWYERTVQTMSSARSRE
jgi:hypothetical protein